MDVGGQHVSSLLVNPNVKLPAVSSADYTAVAALLQQLLAAVVFAGSEIISISPQRSGGEMGIISQPAKTTAAVNCCSYAATAV